MLKLIIAFTGIILLTGCFESGIVTDSDQLDDYIEEEQDTLSEDISVFFERHQYGLDERDEMFYIVENNSDETIEMAEHFFIQKYEDNEWVPTENHDFRRDSAVRIPAGESTELLFWLSVDSIEFEKGQYRLFTRVNFPEQTEEIREQYPDYEDIYLPFEIK